MTVGARLGIITTAVVGVFAAYSVLSIVEIRITSKAQDDTATIARTMHYVGVLDATVEAMTADSRKLMLAAAMKTPNELQQAREEFASHAATFTRTFEAVRPLMDTESELKELSTVTRLFEEWKGVFQQMAELCAAGQLEAAQQLRTTRAVPISDELDRVTTRLVDAHSAELDATEKDCDRTVNRALWSAVVAAAMSLFLGIAGILMVRSAVNSIRNVATELAGASQQVASAAGQVCSASQSLAQGASEQAASLEETSASGEQIHAMTEKNSDSARSAGVLAVQAAQEVGEANHKLDGMIASMKDIKGSSDKISRIIKVIDEIAFQTNILALNAAVEAARAGESGLGFAVVADEVRTLAQRSAQAAHDTAGLIEESIGKSSEGSNRLDQVAQAIAAITETADKVKTHVDDVVSASAEQARGISQIAEALSQMQQVTQRSAATSQETAAAGNELASQSQALVAISGRLIDMVGEARR